jgi:hypothetical protein
MIVAVRDCDAAAAWDIVRQLSQQQSHGTDCCPKRRHGSSPGVDPVASQHDSYRAALRALCLDRDDG